MERIWKEEFVAQFKVLPQHFVGTVEENHVKISQDTWYHGRDMGLDPFESIQGVTAPPTPSGFCFKVIYLRLWQITICINKFTRMRVKAVF
jgi:hypothetical protein